MELKPITSTAVHHPLAKHHHESRLSLDSLVTFCSTMSSTSLYHHLTCSPPPNITSVAARQQAKVIKIMLKFVSH